MGLLDGCGTFKILGSQKNILDFKTFLALVFGEDCFVSN